MKLDNLIKTALKIESKYNFNKLSQKEGDMEYAVTADFLPVIHSFDNKIIDFVQNYYKDEELENMPTTYWYVYSPFENGKLNPQKSVFSLIVIDKHSFTNKPGAQKGPNYYFKTPDVECPLCSQILNSIIQFLIKNKENKTIDNSGVLFN
jgi:hypothetical protein